MGRAAWEGLKLSYFQNSFESPALFVLFQLIFSTDLKDFKTCAISKGITEKEWK